MSGWTARKKPQRCHRFDRAWGGKALNT
jgi:hypothetical protein